MTETFLNMYLLIHFIMTEVLYDLESDILETVEIKIPYSKPFCFPLSILDHQIHLLNGEMTELLLQQAYSKDREITTLNSCSDNSMAIYQNKTLAILVGR